MVLFERNYDKKNEAAQREMGHTPQQRAFAELKPMVIRALDRLGKDLYGRSFLKARYAILEYDSIFRLSLQWNPKEMVPFPVLNVTFQNFEKNFEKIEIYNPRNEACITIPVDQTELEAAIAGIAPALYQN
ncbi:MAG: hypothetical protein ACP5SH_14470 [Syntrophobacteraceae bacterium]